VNAILKAMVKTVCVFCGSSLGNSPIYSTEAHALGRLIAAEGLHMVYGGSDVGLMGIIARSAIDAGARVTGVIPRSIYEKVGHDNGAELIIVSSMHERKSRMFELADAFLAMPGGIGTLEEIFEVLTWSQLGYHSKPAGFLNIEGYFDGLLAFLDSAKEKGFIRQVHRDNILSSPSSKVLLSALQTFEPVMAGKWHGKEE
jgi:uncharacterized protein (TIGR00730 family)